MELSVRPDQLDGQFVAADRPVELVVSPGAVECQTRREQMSPTVRTGVPTSRIRATVVLCSTHVLHPPRCGPLTYVRFASTPLWSSVLRTSCIHPAVVFHRQCATSHGTCAESQLAIVPFSTERRLTVASRYTSSCYSRSRATVPLSASSTSTRPSSDRSERSPRSHSRPRSPSGV